MLSLHRNVPVKSYLLTGLSTSGAHEGTLTDLLPGQTHPWILLHPNGDVIAYFNIAQNGDIHADISGRHYNEDRSVLNVLESLKAKLGGNIEYDP
jgi:hypothetical protein